MGFLTKEEKKYILEAGDKWDGRSVHDGSKDIVRKCRDAFDDILWLLENMDPIRSAYDTEFKSKYSDPKKRWEGKGAPRRSKLTSEKFVTDDRMARFLELYIRESVDIPYYEDWPGSSRRGRGSNKLLMEHVEKVKNDLVEIITNVEVEIA
jgi:hypothetical protein